MLGLGLLLLMLSKLELPAAKFEFILLLLLYNCAAVLLLMLTLLLLLLFVIDMGPSVKEDTDPVVVGVAVVVDRNLLVPKPCGSLLLKLCPETPELADDINDS